MKPVIDDFRHPSFRLAVAARRFTSEIDAGFIDHRTASRVNRFVSETLARSDDFERLNERLAKAERYIRQLKATLRDRERKLAMTPQIQGSI